MATAGPGPARRLAGAGACLGLAVLAKLVPILLVPAWTRSAARGAGWKRGAVLLGSCAAVVAVGVAPFAIGAPGLPPGLVTYAVSWEWNGPLFEPLWRLLDAAGAAPWVKARLDQVRDATGWHQALHRVYPLVYPQLLAKAILGSALLVVVLSSLRRADPVAAALRIFAGVLLLSATVYPWYALWVLPWAALEWRLPWLVLSSSLLASYLPRLLDVPLLPWPFLLVWSPFLYALWRARRQPTA